MKLFTTLVFGLVYAASAQPSASTWYLESTGTPTATVGGTNTPEIQLNYEISSRARTVQVFASDCATATTAVTASLQAPTAIQNSVHLALVANLDVDPTQVASSNLWTNVNSTTGRIELCVRVDLRDGTGTSYNFKETKLYVTIDLSQGFTIAAIDVDRTAAGTVNTNAQTNYGLTVCQCNELSVCGIATLVQGDAASICITTTAGSGVEISSVQQLTYAQAGVVSIPAIANGVKNELTDVNNQGTAARIQSQLPSVLFDPANIDIPLVGSGVVVVRFGSGRVRNLRFVIGDSVGHIEDSAVASRMMQEQTKETQTTFSVSMALAPIKAEEPPKAEANTGALIGAIVGAIAGVAMIVALVLAARRKKEDDKEEGAMAGSIVCAEYDKKDEAKAGLNVRSADETTEICA